MNGQAAYVATASQSEAVRRSALLSAIHVLEDAERDAREWLENALRRRDRFDIAYYIGQAHGCSDAAARLRTLLRAEGR